MTMKQSYLYITDNKYFWEQQFLSHQNIIRNVKSLITQVHIPTRIFIKIAYRPMTQAITFITNRICPFAQRAWLVLLEKEIPFTFKEATLGNNKEAWFKEAYANAFGRDPNADGKVPIIIHGDKTITESDLISWYLAETFPTGTQLIPTDTFQRLKMRRFIQEVPGKLIAAFYSTRNYHLKTEEEKIQVVNKILENLRIVEREIEGPYVLGDTFSLADILLYPWLERWCVNENLFGIKFPEELTKLKTFISAVQSRPSVKKALSEVSEEFFTNGYLSYLKPE